MGLKLKPGQRLVIATHNPGKAREIAELLLPHCIDVVSAGELGLPEPEETGNTFATNAALKARAAAQASGQWALADDSGLEVQALNGAPGIYSARWAGEQKDFSAAMARVHAELEAKGAMTPEARCANFTCVLALADPEGPCDTYEGKVHGTLVWPPRGTRGFGYDPLFVADGMRLTFGEIEPEAKHAISHRARAFEKFERAALGHDGDG